MLTAIYKWRWRLLPVLSGPTLFLLRVIPLSMKVRRIEGGYCIRRWHIYAIWIEAAHAARSASAIAFRARQGG